MSESFGRQVQSRIYRNGASGTGPAVPTNPDELERRALAGEAVLPWS